jgi:hypothetical protein
MSPEIPHRIRLGGFERFPINLCRRAVPLETPVPSTDKKREIQTMIGVFSENFRLDPLTSLKGESTDDGSWT